MSDSQQSVFDGRHECLARSLREKDPALSLLGADGLLVERAPSRHLEHGCIDHHRAKFFDEIQRKGRPPMGIGVEEPGRGVESGDANRDCGCSKQDGVPYDRAALTTSMGGLRLRPPNPSPSGSRVARAPK